MKSTAEAARHTRPAIVAPSAMRLTHDALTERIRGDRDGPLPHRCDDPRDDVGGRLDLGLGRRPAKRQPERPTDSSSR